VILLDTNAIVWMLQGHRRGRPLQGRAAPLYLSPVSLLEIQLLTEIGRIRLHSGSTVRDLAVDDRWVLDNPSSVDWFEHALEMPWTDPFDRLIAAHAALRGWRVATGDAALIERLGPARCVEL
jgi:PIN domain nuclease of toxin-antitoxin system